jgi:hypothetical protein
MESKINISARVKNKEAMEDFLDYLVKDSKYKFFITSFTVPNIVANKEFTIQIPLTMFYTDIK